MEVTLLYFDGCPHWEAMDRLLDGLEPEYGFAIAKRKVSSAEEAEAIQFRGSPTMLVDGVDPFADAGAPVGVSCRVYATPEGLRGTPTVDMVRAALDAGRRE
jgi:glutaredoxin